VIVSDQEVRTAVEGQTLVVTFDQPKPNAIDVTASRVLAERRELRWQGR
jgi:hypothetical protein